MRRLLLAIAVAAVVMFTACGSDAPASAPGYERDAVLRVNDVQVIGTHNSYHLRPPRALPPGDVADYEHPPLDVQLDEQGVRSFELDVFNGPSFPVAHTPIIDATSTCSTFGACLRVLGAWSNRHPGHVPIFVIVEPKTQTIVLDPTLVPWDAAAVKRLDAEVRSVLGPKDLLVPDQVRGRSSTLRDAVVGRGWPTLRAARGRIALVLNTAGPVRDLYLAGRDSLEGAPMFVTADVHAPSAAVLKRDDPVAGEIRRLVEQGFVVRTRADDRGIEARAGDLTRATTAIGSGAQIVSTDYPVADPTIGSYVVRLEGGRPARCNPVIAARRCRAIDIENPKRLRQR